MNQGNNKGISSSEMPPISINREHTKIKFEESEDRKENYTIEIVIEHKEKCFFRKIPKMEFNLSKGKLDFGVHGAKITSGKEKTPGLCLKRELKDFSNSSDPNSGHFMIDILNYLPGKLGKFIVLKPESRPSPSSYTGTYNIDFSDHKDSNGKYYEFEGNLSFEDSSKEANLNLSLSHSGHEGIRIKKIEGRESQLFLNHDFVTVAYVLRSWVISISKQLASRNSKYVIIAVAAFWTILRLSPFLMNWIRQFLPVFGNIVSQNNPNYIPFPFLEVLLLSSSLILIGIWILFDFSKEKLQKRIVDWLDSSYGKPLDHKEISILKRGANTIPVRVSIMIRYSSNDSVSKGKRFGLLGGGKSTPPNGDGSCLLNEYARGVLDLLEEKLRLQDQEELESEFSLTVKFGNQKDDDSCEIVITGPDSMPLIIKGWESLAGDIPVNIVNIRLIKLRRLNLSRPDEAFLEKIKPIAGNSSEHEYEGKLFFEECQFDGNALSAILFKSPEPTEVIGRQELSDKGVVVKKSPTPEPKDEYDPNKDRDLNQPNLLDGNSARSKHNL